MEKLILSLSYFVLSISSAANWADVSFLSKTNYQIKLERFDPPIVFEWRDLIKRLAEHCFRKGSRPRGAQQGKP
jgi:hypothetical protein